LDEIDSPIGSDGSHPPSVIVQSGTGDHKFGSKSGKSLEAVLVVAVVAAIHRFEDTAKLAVLGRNLLVVRLNVPT
jgi:hypothetical protein